MVDLNPSASFSLKIELEIPNRPGALASVMSTIATYGGSLGDIVLLQRNLKFTHRELTIDASSTEQGDKIVDAIILGWASGKYRKLGRLISPNGGFECSISYLRLGTFFLADAHSRDVELDVLLFTAASS